MKAPHNLNFYHLPVKAGRILKFRSIPWAPKGDTGGKLIAFFDVHIDRNTEALEFGSGGSTLWFAKHAKSIIAFEHDPFYYRMLMADLKRRRLTKRAEVVLDEDYPSSLNLGQRQFDFILNDGQHRLPCARLITRLLKPGGLVICTGTNRTPAVNERRIYGAAGFRYVPIIPGIRAAWRRSKR